MAAVILGVHAIVPRPSEGAWAAVDRDCLVRARDADAPALGDGTGEVWR